MKIALGSTSCVKQASVLSALHRFSSPYELVSVSARSNVSEQPIENETYHGAINRVVHTASLVPDADFSLAIESGIFLRNNNFYDVAVVVARSQYGQMVISESEAVQFPDNCVMEALQRDGDWTAGMVLQEKGIVKDHKDPHQSLTGKSRAEYITEAVYEVLQMILKTGKVATNG
jgi:non-canonical (house-cleaning) NTP pyrophosphatase